LDAREEPSPRSGERVEHLGATEVLDLEQVVLLGVAHQFDPADQAELAHQVGTVVLDGANR